MMIPVRAIYKRRERGEPEGPPEMISAEYADVPIELIAGTLAEGAAAIAAHRGDLENAERIREAAAKACADGKLMTL